MKRSSTPPVERPDTRNELSWTEKKLLSPGILENLKSTDLYSTVHAIKDGRRQAHLSWRGLTLATSRTFAVATWVKDAPALHDTNNPYRTVRAYTIFSSVACTRLASGLQSPKAKQKIAQEVYQTTKLTPSKPRRAFGTCRFHRK